VAASTIRLIKVLQIMTCSIKNAVSVDCAGMLHGYSMHAMQVRNRLSIFTWRFLLLVILLVAHFLCASHSIAGVMLYSQDFESPVGFSQVELDVSTQLVNDLYGNQPPGFSFAQQFTVETLLLTGTAAWGTGYSDPSGIGGNYALGMLSSAQNDLLGLSFDAQDYAYFNLKLDISSVDINGIGGPFVSAGSVPVFEFTLYDNPTGATGLGSGTILDVQQATGTASAQDVLDWTNVILPLDASGSTNGNVTLRIDMLSGGYAALDNFLIVASDVAGDVSAVPEPVTAIAMGLLGVVGFAGRRRRRRASDSLQDTSEHNRGAAV